MYEIDENVALLEGMMRAKYMPPARILWIGPSKIHFFFLDYFDYFDYFLDLLIASFFFL